ncbi:hypothetical protein GQ42DRAFT_165983 [Ramicandelaber brevisporus]|nr:hypothetical protein GQ42DRAFT_166001 [Ramicandelaber brevisporus]KAI8865605.1 hypothetical protein GQ42DRAFT_165983 [Ramicandelaber brevisporus]
MSWYYSQPKDWQAQVRAGFRYKNAVSGAVLVGFVTAVYFYSISAVRQDDFNDPALVAQRPSDKKSQ